MSQKIGLPDIFASSRKQKFSWSYHYTSHTVLGQEFFTLPPQALMWYQRPGFYTSPLPPLKVLHVVLSSISPKTGLESRLRDK